MEAKRVGKGGPWHRMAMREVVRGDLGHEAPADKGEARVAREDPADHLRNSWPNLTRMGMDN